ncbi:hypothetical protein A3J41_01895 [candidate division TM6 bacterium RIFCSPHIGHO2_12_FULL_38_8]|nr:MAG: hypothetical protein A3J41_01895 [candidate division TM6 bacterium RIFCSPHIGHO2_12_FULL_38_8]
MKRFFFLSFFFILFFSTNVQADQATQVRRIVDVVKTLGQQPQDCAICGDAFARNMRRLECGHEFCSGCLGAMLDIALREKSSKGLVCPTPGCRARFTQLDIRNIRRLQHDVDAIGAIQAREWLLTQPGAKQCPTVGCDYVFIVDADEPIAEIRCPACSQQYCNQCLLQHDRTLSCAQAKALRPIDPKTAAFLEQDTKPCPFCNVRVHKIEGCNSMQCGFCHQAFCWRCLMPFEGYEYHDAFDKAGGCRPMEQVRAHIEGLERQLREEEANLRLNLGADRYRLMQIQEQLLRARIAEENFVAFQAKQAKAQPKNAKAAKRN